MISLFANGTAFWTVAAIGLAGVAAYQITDEREPVPAVDRTPVEAALDEGEPVTGEGVDLPSEDLIGEITRRPLFSPSRRPAPADETPDAPVVDTASDDKPVLELIGTMLVDDEPIALLKHPTDGLLRLRPGQRVGGWTIVDVENQRVSLENDDGLDVLTLRKDRIRSKGSRVPKRAREARETNGDEDDEEKEIQAPIRRPM